MKRSFLALTAALVAFGCTEAPTEPESVLLTPSFNFINGPPTAGIVVRGSFNSFGIFENDDGSLVAAFGLGSLDPNQTPICGVDSNFDTSTFQELENPSGVLGGLVQGNGTWHVWADAATFWDQPGLCDALNLPRLAEGFGHISQFDNDIFGSGTRTNVFGMRGQGTLEDLVNGGTTQFNLRFQAQIGKRGFRPILQEITLR